MALEAIADIAANVAPTSPYEAVFDFAVDLSFEIGGWPGRLVLVAPMIRSGNEIFVLDIGKT